MVDVENSSFGYDLTIGNLVKTPSCMDPLISETCHLEESDSQHVGNVVMTVVDCKLGILCVLHVCKAVRPCGELPTCLQNTPHVGLCMYMTAETVNMAFCLC